MGRERDCQGQKEAVLDHGAHSACASQQAPREERRKVGKRNEEDGNAGAQAQRAEWRTKQRDRGKHGGTVTSGIEEEIENEEIENNEMVGREVSGILTGKRPRKVN